MATYSNAPPGESDRLPDKLIARASLTAGAGEAIPRMQMHNPPHPGESLEGVYLEPCELSIRQVAKRLGVSGSTFQRLVAGKSRVSPDMALRLSRVLGRSAESWLAMQDSYDLWHARQRLDLSALTPMELTPE